MYLWSELSHPKYFQYFTSSESYNEYPLTTLSLEICFTKGLPIFVDSEVFMATSVVVLSFRKLIVIEAALFGAVDKVPAVVIKPQYPPSVQTSSFKA